MRAIFVNVKQLEWEVIQDVFAGDEVTVLCLPETPALVPPPSDYVGTSQFLNEEAWRKRPQIHGYLNFRDAREMQTWALRALKMLDRFDTRGQFDFSRRIELFNRFAGFWLKKLRTQKPDFVYFSSAPHEFGDYVVLAVARHLGIPTFLWQELPPLRSKVLTQSLESPWIEYPPLTHTDLSRPSKTDLERCLVSSSAKLVTDLESKPYLERSLGRIKRQNSLSGAFARFYGYAKASLRILNHELSSRGKTEKRVRVNFFRFSLAIVGALGQIFRAKLVADSQKNLLKDVNTVDPERDFGIFYLHYEPEMTVNPLGDVVVQAEAVCALSEALPEGWILYVKEHPGQRDRGEAGFYTGRSESFYASLDALANVRLIGDDLLEAELFGKARFIGSIAGSVGFEALLKGIPVILFGSSWYADFPGVFRPDCQDRLLAWFETKQFLMRPTFEKLRDATETASQSSCNIFFGKSECDDFGALWEPSRFKNDLAKIFGVIRRSMVGHS